MVRVGAGAQNRAWDGRSRYHTAATELEPYQVPLGPGVRAGAVQGRFLEWNPPASGFPAPCTAVLHASTMVGRQLALSPRVSSCCSSCRSRSMLAAVAAVANRDAGRGRQELSEL